MRPAQPGRPVRLPGEKGNALMHRQREEGVTLHPGIVEALKPWAEKLKIALPPAL